MAESIPVGALEVEKILGGASHLIRSGEHLVLVDLGPSDADRGAFVAELAALGVSTDAVTDVVFTDLTPPHIQWAAAGEAETFEYAKHWVHVDQWNYWVEDDNADPDAAFQLGSIRQLVSVWDGDSFELTPWLRLSRVDAETPGAAVAVIHDGADEYAIP